MSTLGERIKTARESKGYLQSDLAKLIGVKSSGVISNWEKDLNKPDAEKIVKICEVLRPAPPSSPSRTCGQSITSPTTISWHLLAAGNTFSRISPPI